MDSCGLGSVAGDCGRCRRGLGRRADHHRCRCRYGSFHGAACRGSRCVDAVVSWISVATSSRAGSAQLAPTNSSAQSGIRGAGRRSHRVGDHDCLRCPGRRNTGGHRVGCGTDGHRRCRWGPLPTETARRPPASNAESTTEVINIIGLLCGATAFATSDESLRVSPGKHPQNRPRPVVATRRSRPVSQTITSKQRMTLMSGPMPARSRTSRRWSCRACPSAERWCCRVR